MKAYLITTGSVFGLLAIMHAQMAIHDRQLWTTNRGEFVSMALLGVFAACLSVWAWRLLLRQSRR